MRADMATMLPEAFLRYQSKAGFWGYGLAASVKLDRPLRGSGEAVSCPADRLLRAGLA